MTVSGKQRLSSFTNVSMANGVESSRAMKPMGKRGTYVGTCKNVKAVFFFARAILQIKINKKDCPRLCRRVHFFSAEREEHGLWRLYRHNHCSEQRSKALLKLPEETFLHHPQNAHNRCTLRRSHDLSYTTTESSSALYPFGVSFTGEQEISFAAYVHGGFTKDGRCRSVPSHNIFFS